MVNNRFFSAIILALALSSCVKEEYNMDRISSTVDVSTSVALPVASGSVSLEQLLPKNSDTSSFIDVDNSKLLHLVYNRTLDSLSFGKYANIVKDVQGSVSVAAPSGVSFPNTSITAQTSYNLNLSLERVDQQIDEALLSDGTLSVSSAANFYGSFSYTIESPDLVDAGGKTLSKTFPQWLNLSLAGYKVMPNGGKQLRFTIRYTVTKQGSSATPDKITFSLGLSSLKVKELVGSLGQISIPLGGNSLPLDFSDYVFKVDNFDIKDPAVKLIFKNHAALPFSFSHNGVVAKKGAESYVITGLPSPIDVLPAGAASKRTISEAAIGGGSNLVNVLAKFPNTLSFNGTLLANPNTPQNPAVKNRINVNDKLYIGAKADLALNIMASNLVFTDTSSYNFADLVKDSKSVDKMKLQLQLKNGFPVNMEVNAYIVDEKGNVLDKILATPFLLKAATVSNGNVVSPTDSKVDADYDQVRIQKLKNGNRIIFEIKASTEGYQSGQSVKLLASHKVDIKVIGFVKANLNNL